MKTIKQVREETGLNQTDFWGRVGVKQSGGSRYESGRAIPKPVKMLLDIAYGEKERSRRVVSTLRGK